MNYPFEVLPAIEIPGWGQVPTAIIEDAVTHSLSELEDGNPDRVWERWFPELNRIVSQRIWRSKDALQVIFRIQREMLAKIDSDNDKPAQKYRKYAGFLRQAKEVPGPYQRVLQYTLRDLILSSSTPMNDLDTPYWIDSYTGAVDGYRPSLEEIIPEKRETGGDGWMALAEAILEFDEWESETGADNAADADSSALVPAQPKGRNPYSEKPLPKMIVIPGTGAFDIVYDGNTAKAYQDGVKVTDKDILTRLAKIVNAKFDPKMDELFAQAAGESGGIIYDPIDDLDDDRGYVPPTIEGLSELQTTEDLSDLYRLARPFTQPIRDMVARMMASGKARNMPIPEIIKQVQDAVLMCQERYLFLEFLRDKAHEGYEPQDILMVFLSMQNGLMLPETDAHFVTLPGPNRTLWDFYQLFGDEILESQGNVGLGHNELNPDELEKIADHMLEEVLSTMPERDANIKFTRKWNEHYIRAVISGAPIFVKGKDEDEEESEETDRKMTAYELAYAGWRSDFSPSGAESYNAVIATGGDTKAAWSAFYREGRKAGDIKDIITGVKQTGLIISPNCSVEKREINWGLAMYKLRQGELVFSDIKDQLVAALRQTGWGPNFLKAISA